MSDAPVLLGGRYEVGELLGRGGMAEVHRGYDTRLGRDVAVKMLRSDLARDGSFLIRFRREAQASAGLNHPSIVAVYDSGEDHSVESGGAQVAIPYIVMEYVPGRTLREVLQEREHLDPLEATRITEGVLDALAYSHRKGIVHRDIKPANVMLTRGGGIKVMDFGIARALADASATMTQTQAVLGTAQYLSPEQAQGHSVDARSDLYSTGCLLFELLTGRPPFLGESPVSIAYQHVGEAPDVPSELVAEDIPEDLDAVVLHALAKDRETRYQHAEDFADDLRCVRLGRPISEGARATAAAVGLAGAAGVAGAAGAARAAGAGAPTEVVPTANGGGALVGSGVGAAAGGGFPPDDPVMPLTPRSSTSELPRVAREEERRRRRGALWVMLTIGALIALALAGWGLKTFLDNKAAQESMRTVPSVYNLNQAQAEAKVRSADLVPKVQRAPSQTIPEGQVVKQSPDPGSSVEQGSTVTITVSSGPSSVVVPTLAGMSEDAARKKLEDEGLGFGRVIQVNDSSVAKGKVVGSDPAAGASVQPGTPVNLKISTGQVHVPELTGKNRDEAVALLTQAGLKWKVSFQESTDVDSGTVLKQSRSAGELVDRGSEVEILVAMKPTATPTTAPPTSSQTTGTSAPTPSTTPSTPTPTLPTSGSTPTVPPPPN